MRLWDDIEAVARFGADGEGVTRVAWSAALLEACTWLVGALSELGLDASIDAAGNVVGRWNAGGGDEHAVVVGSHLDTVPRGGRFDGALGVLAGLDAIRSLRAEGFEPARPIWLVAFMDEEGARFETTMLGSRAFCGDDVRDAAARVDADGIPLADAMATWGRSWARVAEARAIDRVGAYVELHIEQGPVLGRAGADIGIVTGIYGSLGCRAAFTGHAGHAGTTPMDARRDALAGAARAILALREDALDDGAIRTTVGIVSAEPGGSNVIPGRAEFSIDVRAVTGDALDAAQRRIEALLAGIAAAEGLEWSLDVLSRLEPLELDAGVVAAIEAAARDAGASSLALASGAGHDAMVVGRHVPAGMLFVPSRAGVSHNPAEYTAPEQCETGARVLAATLRRLAA